LPGMPSAERIRGDHAKAAWFECIARTQDRDKGLSYTDAMSKARRENPDLFQAYQSIGGEQAKGRTV
jgi:hypothetical protein